MTLPRRDQRPVRLCVLFTLPHRAPGVAPRAAWCPASCVQCGLVFCSRYLTAVASTQGAFIVAWCSVLVYLTACCVSLARCVQCSWNQTQFSLAPYQALEGSMAEELGHMDMPGISKSWFIKVVNIMFFNNILIGILFYFIFIIKLFIFYPI